MITLEVTLPQHLVLTSNQRGRWTRHSGPIRELRERGRGAWLPHEVTRTQYQRLRCIAWLTFADRRHRDGQNYMATIKPLIDGIVRGRTIPVPGKPRARMPEPGWCGILPDDHAAHLVGPDLRITDPDPTLTQRGLWLRIRLEFEEA